jgi:hypothetical protein
VYKKYIIHSFVPSKQRASALSSGHIQETHRKIQIPSMYISVPLLKIVLETNGDGKAYELMPNTVEHLSPAWTTSNLKLK